ncbi:hypothetical protein J3E68DRAFT_403993 [Trichoderma sp. SZMC 28012]
MLHVRLGLKLTSSNKGHGNLWLSEPCTYRVTLRYCRLMDCRARCVNTCKSTCHYFVSVELVRIAHVLQGMKLSASTNKMTGGLFPLGTHTGYPCFLSSLLSPPPCLFSPSPSA